MKLYKCRDTGLLLEEINNFNNDLELSFCSIKGYFPKEHEEGLTEKHIPEYERNGNVIKVTVGSVPHPMTKEHHIECVTLETNKGLYRKMLKDSPTISFSIDDDEEIINIYSYCNLHGLWINKRKEEEKMKKFVCDVCGTTIEMKDNSKDIPRCCGQDMREVKNEG